MIDPTPQRPSLDELMRQMPPRWRHRWCEAELCGCLGCANGSGRIVAHGYTREEHAEWLANNPQGPELWTGSCLLTDSRQCFAELHPTTTPAGQEGADG